MATCGLLVAAFFAALLLASGKTLHLNLNVCYVDEKALGETQTLHAGCSKAEPQIFALPQTPFPGAQNS